VQSVNEWELWLCAARLMREHGTAAVAEAQAQVAMFAAAGNAVLSAEWSVVRERIAHLQSQGVRLPPQMN
jgi:hypothetical protein